MTRGRLQVLFSILLLAVSPAFAATITDLGLYGTGTQVSGGIDQQWLLDGGSAYVVSYPFPSYIGSAWYSTDNNASNSQWISTDAGGHGSANTVDTIYNYTASFSVPAQYVLSSIVIQGWATFDDFATGSITGAGQFLDNQTTGGLSSPNLFTITGLTQADNTITFAVKNMGLVGNTGPNPTGLRVQFTSVTGDVVPEPSTLALLGGGLLALGFLRRRR